jgi:hypothetical protein
MPPKKSDLSASTWLQPDSVIMGTRLLMDGQKRFKQDIRPKDSQNATAIREHNPQ